MAAVPLLSHVSAPHLDLRMANEADGGPSSQPDPCPRADGFYALRRTIPSHTTCSSALRWRAAPSLLCSKSASHAASVRRWRRACHSELFCDPCRALRSPVRRPGSVDPHRLYPQPTFRWHGWLTPLVRGMVI